MIKDIIGDRVPSSQKQMVSHAKSIALVKSTFIEAL